MRLAALRRRLQRFSVTATMIVTVLGSGLAVGAVDIDDAGVTERLEAGVRVRMLTAKSRPVTTDVRQAKRLAVEAKMRERAVLPTSDVDVDPAVWDRLADCESDRRWDADTGNGYYGGLQFSLASWRAVGGPGTPDDASKDVQIAYAERLLERQGWRAWPSCSQQLGLR